MTAYSPRASGPGPGRCTDDVCITCGDVAVPVRVVRLLPHDLAVVEVDGHEEEVSVALVAADVGATVLVHAGEAIACVDPEAQVREAQ
jgi:hydrogenase expression/formation protein HypC